MTEEKKKKTTAESFGDMVKAFGEAVAEVFDDPALKEKARDLAASAGASARAMGSRVKDEEVKTKFRQAGRAAQEFGKKVSEYFKEEK